MTKPLRVLQFGLGPIGCACARLVCERQDLELVGGIDIDPAKAGQDLGAVIGTNENLGVKVAKDLSAYDAEADVAIHTTRSYFPTFQPQLEALLGAGLDIVSTSEELSFPWQDHDGEANALNNAALRAGRTVLGTGINPGFLMDTLPLCLTAIAQRVDRVDIVRIINASKRRGPFQAKIGSGLTVEVFRERMAEGTMGHVGLPESAAMLCNTLGRNLVRFTNQVEPVVAETEVTTDYFSVRPGEVRGLEQTGTAYTDEGVFLSLTFRAALDEEPEGDTISIQGRPDLTMRLEGANGDLGTVAMAVNAARRVHEAPPGLVTMRDLPLVTAGR